MTFKQGHKFYPGGVLFKKGQKPWNKGLTKESDKRVKNMIEKTNKTKTLNNSFISGKKHYNWKGGTIIQEGYRYILIPEHPRAKSKKGYVAEHVLVMEKHLGRLLKSEEVVHHIDRNKLNNTISNLFLFPNDKLHLSFHKMRIKNIILTEKIFMETYSKWEK